MTPDRRVTPDRRAVQVWLLHTGQPATVLHRLRGLLDPEEGARADAMPDPAVRADFVASHGALRVLLTGLLERPAAGFRWRYGRHGKPELLDHPGVHCNISHSDGLAVIAVSRHAPVGVDVQRRRTGPGLVELARRYYRPEEADQVTGARNEQELAEHFGRLWSRKEACVKVSGGRLIPALAWPSGVSSDASGQIASGPPDGSGPVTVADLAVPAGFDAAVALAGAQPFELRCGWWEPEPGQDPVAGAPAGDRPGAELAGIAAGGQAQ